MLALALDEFKSGQDNLASLSERADQHLNPPEILPTGQWLQKHYVLPKESGASGVYDFYYTPYFLGVAAAIDNESIPEVVLQKASQIGWTYFVIGYLLKRIATTPCPILGVFAKEKDAKSFHDEKLLPMASANPILEGKIDAGQARKSGQRWDLKKFPGGFLKMVGSNSPGNVKSTSAVGLCFVEEPDDTSDDVKGQGDAISLSRERLKRYTGNKKLIVGGTPAVKGLSKTEKLVEQSDCRVLPVVCHECGESHVLSFDNVSWEGKDADAQLSVDTTTGEVLTPRHEVFGFAQPETAVYQCPHCLSEWDDVQRQHNIRNTVFTAIDNNDPNCGWVATQAFYGIVGFSKLSELYACIPGTSLAKLVTDYLEAKHYAEIGDDSHLITFVNQKLGEAYQYNDGGLDAEQLEQKAANDAFATHEHGDIPEQALVLTAGVDVQHNRVEYVIRAWGRGEESWLVKNSVIAAGESCIDGEDPVWFALEQELLTKDFTHPNGGKISIQALSIDSSDGGTSDAVYAWVRRVKKLYTSKTIMAIKGIADGQAQIYKNPYESLDVRDPKNRIKSKSKARSKYSLFVFNVGTHRAKDLLSAKIKLEGQGAGKFHFCRNAPLSYFEQMTSEIRLPKSRYRFEWVVKSGQRNQFRVTVL